MPEQTTILERLKAFIAKHSDRSAWVIACVAMLLIVTFFNPAKFLAFVWIAAKIIGAALIGAGLFRTWDVHPETLEGIERAMAYTRRVTLMAAAIVSAAFTP